MLVSRSNSITSNINKWKMLKNANIGTQKNVCLLTTATVLNQIVSVSLNSRWLKTAYISKTLKVQFNQKIPQA